MKKEEIHLWDIKRILLGEAPPEFLLDVFIRDLIIYLLAIVVTRWQGKRMNGQLILLDFGVILTMGAIVSPAMQLPERDTLLGALVVLLTLLLLSGTNWLAFHNSNFCQPRPGLSIIPKRIPRFPANISKAKAWTAAKKAVNKTTSAPVPIAARTTG